MQALHIRFKLFKNITKRIQFLMYKPLMMLKFIRISLTLKESFNDPFPTTKPAFPRNPLWYCANSNRRWCNIINFV